MLVFNEEKHEYTVDGIKIKKSLTQILESVGIIDFSCVPERILGPALRFGKAVHKATELYDLGILDESALDPALKPYLAGWVKFLKDTGFVAHLIEKPLAAKIYGTWIATTPDRIGMMKGKLTDVEIKSGSLLPGTAIQTAGHKLIYDVGKEFKNHIKVRLGVRLTGDGNWRPEYYKNKNDMSVFLSALNITNWKELNS